MPTTTLYAVADSYLASAGPTLNKDGLGFLAAGQWNTTGEGTLRPVLRFDVASIPGTITAAKLVLTEGYRDSGSYATHAYRLTKAWVESQVAWNNAATGSAWATAGGDFDSGSLGSYTATETGETYLEREIALAAATVEAMRTGANHGFLLRSLRISGGAEDRYVDYLDRSEGAYGPRLVVTHEEGGGGVNHDGDASFGIALGITAVGSHAGRGTATHATALGITASARKGANGNAALDTAFDFTAAGHKGLRVAVSLDAAIGLSADGTHAASAAASFDAAFRTDVATVKGASAGADFETAVGITAEGAHTGTAEATFETAFGFDAAGVASQAGGGAADFMAALGFEATGHKGASAQATLDTALGFVVTADEQRLKGEADYSTTLDFDADGFRGTESAASFEAAFEFIVAGYRGAAADASYDTALELVATGGAHMPRPPFSARLTSREGASRVTSPDDGSTRVSGREGSARIRGW